LILTAADLKGSVNFVFDTLPIREYAIMGFSDIFAVFNNALEQFDTIESIGNLIAIACSGIRCKARGNILNSP
jgi:hypothetical protein